MGRGSVPVFVSTYYNVSRSPSALIFRESIHLRGQGKERVVPAGMAGPRLEERGKGGGGGVGAGWEISLQVLSVLVQNGWDINSIGTSAALCGS